MNRYQKAEYAQSACNLAGLANSLIEMVREVHGEGGDVREDPAVRLVVHQMAFLTIGEPNWDYVKASNECARRAPMTASQLHLDVAFERHPASVLASTIRETKDMTAEQIERALTHPSSVVQLAVIDKAEWSRWRDAMAAHLAPDDSAAITLTPHQIARAVTSANRDVAMAATRHVLAGAWTESVLERAGITVDVDTSRAVPSADEERWIWRDNNAPGGDTSGSDYVSHEAAVHAALDDHWPLRDWATETLNGATGAPYAEWVNERVDEVLAHRAPAAAVATFPRMSA